MHLILLKSEHPPVKHIWKDGNKSTIGHCKEEVNTFYVCQNKEYNFENLFSSLEAERYRIVNCNMLKRGFYF
ncbi:hypothetical protein T01_15244 [Trichinella spiralis]|uniref:Uncharacterized protein n=1 Tax=Trichinella spiralis TaxID=6334 RepID=A0A0V1BTI7_TRISP|nr:hypothetical protein T01_15244 [Trichinella spiralis]